MAEHRVKRKKEPDARQAPQTIELESQPAAAPAVPAPLAAGATDQQVAAHLRDTRLHPPQREALASRVGRYQGNRALQRLLRSQEHSEVWRHTGPEPGWEMPLPPNSQTVNVGAVQRETSTPTPKDAKVGEEGSATLNVGDTTVVIKPDVSSKAKSLKGKAETVFNVEQAGQPKNFAQVKGGKVVSFKPMPAVTITIQTSYGEGVTGETKSAYGKGTTEEDIKAGKTTLKHHEGEHGTDYVKYVRDHPLPQFKGQVGMDVKDFKKAMQDYQKDMEDYRKDMEKQSKASTDCVGIQADFCQDK